MGEYYEFLSIIYDEYFDNRAYLLDLYIVAFTQIIDQQNLTLDQYIISFLSAYGLIIKQEEEYFELQFGGVQKFKMFRRDYELHLINQYICPKIAQCQDFMLLCKAIDETQNNDMARAVNEETC